MKELQKWKTDHWLSKVKKTVGMEGNKQARLKHDIMRNHCSDGNVLYLNSVDVDNSAVIPRDWTTLTPFCQLHLWPAVLLIPLSASLRFIYSQGVCPSQVSSISPFALAFMWYESWKNAFSVKVIYFKRCVNTMVGLLKRMSKCYIELLLQWVYTSLLLRSHIHLFFHLFNTHFSAIYSMSNSCDWLKQKIRWYVSIVWISTVRLLNNTLFLPPHFQMENKGLE